MSLRKKPWNRTDHPVYSISITDASGTNMNLITYVSAVSMKPKRFALAVYKNTRTLSMIRKQRTFVLQLLSQEQYVLARLLGKTSGFHVDKLERLRRRKALDTWQGQPVLRDSLALMDMRWLSQQDAGDHVLFLCDVIRWTNLNEGEPLTLSRLSAQKIISI